MYITIYKKNENVNFYKTKHTFVKIYYYLLFDNHMNFRVLDFKCMFNKTLLLIIYEHKSQPFCRHFLVFSGGKKDYSYIYLDECNFYSISMKYK